MNITYRPVILAINVEGSANGRKICEHLENRRFDSTQGIIDAIDEEEKLNTGDYFWYDLTDFMDMCNNQEFNLNNWWITYIYLNDTER